MKKILFVFAIISVFILTTACSKDHAFKRYEFNGVKADLTNAKSIGILNTESSEGKRTSFLVPLVVQAEGQSIQYENNQLAKLTNDEKVEVIKFSDQNDQETKLPYAPVFTQDMGGFTAIFYVHHDVFTENNDYLYQLNKSIGVLMLQDDPISSLFLTSIIDLGYHFNRPLEEGDDQPFSLVFINNETGHLFDYHQDILPSLLNDALNEERGYQTVSVTNVFSTDEFLSFLVWDGQGKSHRQVNIAFNSSLNSLEKSYEYAPNQEEREFTPLFVDQSNNLLYLSHSQFNVKSGDVLKPLGEELNYLNTLQMRIDGTIYLTTFDYDTYEIKLGMIDHNSEYISLIHQSMGISQSVVEEFEMLQNNILNRIPADNQNRNYYDIDNIDYEYLKIGNKIFLIGTELGFLHTSYVFDLEAETINKIELPLSIRNILINNKLYSIFIDHLVTYDFETGVETRILDGFTIENYYDNFFNYYNEDIYFKVSEGENLYINTKTGEISMAFPTLDEGDLSSMVDISD
jgi:hypothetical protein